MPVSTRRQQCVSAAPLSTSSSSTNDDSPEETVAPTPARSSTRKRMTVTPSPPTGISAEPDVAQATAKRAKKPPHVRDPPQGWQDTYALVEELRQDRTAPVDDGGCEVLAKASGDPKDFRFCVLISLILSSQTKDATVAQAVRGMQQDGVLNIASVAHMSSDRLNKYINKVGFHNHKTKYIKQSVDILQSKYNDDIPKTAQEMIADLPGVGPKMAFICENVAWNTVSGIGVDTHMHRIFNAIGWVKSKTPEQTRLQLESWLPREKWSTVNLLWVGFGQEAQQFKPKMLRKALDCSNPPAALRLLKRCGLDYVKEGKKLGLGEEVRAAQSRAAMEQEK